MRGTAVRKWFWVGAGVVQGALLLGMAAAAAWLSGVAAGLVVVGALALFSIASGVGSVAFSDVLGKTVPQERRGRLLALRSAAGGLFTLVAGGVLHAVLTGGDVARSAFVGLLLAAAVLWVSAAALFARIPEPPGATTDTRNALAEARSGLSALRAHRWFRRFVLARALLVATELALPYYVLLARGGGVAALGGYIVAVGLANLAGSPGWGRLADRVSSRTVLVLGGLVATAAAGLALALAAASAEGAASFAAVFLLAALGQAGVRIGRKAYVVNAAPTEERPLYVAASNTIVGLAAVAFIAMGGVAAGAGVTVVVDVVLALGVLGVLVARLLPPAEVAHGTVS